MKFLASALQQGVQVGERKRTRNRFSLRGDGDVETLMFQERIDRMAVVVLHGRSRSRMRRAVAKIPNVLCGFSCFGDNQLGQCVDRVASEVFGTGGMKRKLRHLSHCQPDNVWLLWWVSDLEDGDSDVGPHVRRLDRRGHDGDWPERTRLREGMKSWMGGGRRWGGRGLYQQGDRLYVHRSLRSVRGNLNRVFARAEELNVATSGRNSIDTNSRLDSRVKLFTCRRFDFNKHGLANQRLRGRTDNIADERRHGDIDTRPNHERCKGSFYRTLWGQ